MIFPPTASFQFRTAVALYRVVPELTYTFGFTGNILAFVVILRMRPFTNASLFLSALAVSDFFYLLTNCVTRFFFNFPEVCVYLITLKAMVVIVAVAVVVVTLVVVVEQWWWWR